MLREGAETRDEDVEGSTLKIADEVGSCDYPGLRRKAGQRLSSSEEDKLVTEGGQYPEELSKILELCSLCV